MSELVHQRGMALPVDRFNGLAVGTPTVRVTTDEALDLARRAHALGVAEAGGAPR